MPRGGRRDGAAINGEASGRAVRPDVYGRSRGGRVRALSGQAAGPRGRRRGRTRRASPGANVPRCARIRRGAASGAAERVRPADGDSRVHPRAAHWTGEGDPAAGCGRLFVDVGDAWVLGLGHDPQAMPAVDAVRMPRARRWIVRISRGGRLPEVSTRRLSGMLDGVEAAESAASEFAVRRAFAEDAQGIGAVFDAAVRASWTFLGDAAQPPMYSARDWDQLVADHAPPDALLVATDAGHGVIGYVAVHTEAGEIFLVFVHPAHAGRGVRRALLDAAHPPGEYWAHRGVSVHRGAQHPWQSGVRRGGLPSGRHGARVRAAWRRPPRAAPGHDAVGTTSPQHGARAGRHLVRSRRVRGHGDHALGGAHRLPLQVMRGGAQGFLHRPLTRPWPRRRAWHRGA